MSADEGPPPKAEPPAHLGGRAPSFDGGKDAIKEMLRPVVISDSFLPVYPRKQGEDKDDSDAKCTARKRGRGTKRNMW